MSMPAHETDWVVGEWYVGKFTASDLSFYDTNNCQREYFIDARHLHKSSLRAIKAGEDVLQFNLFGIFVKVFFGQCVGPVLKSLPYYWWHSKVIKRTAAADNLWDKIIFPASLFSCTFLPAVYLPSVIICTPTEIKPAIPVRTKYR